MALIDRITRHVDEMPGMSPTVARLTEITRDINCAPKDLLNVIKLDPVLTGKVLKLINSAYFALPNKVISLNHAVIMLGVNTIKNLSLSTAVIDVIKGDSKSEMFDMDKIWEHSLATAVTAKNIAKAMNIDKKILEEFFICGLLHDIGKILMVLYLHDEYQKVIEKAWDEMVDPNSLEEEVLGIDHSEIGRMLAEKWKFSPSLSTAIKRHHNPDFESKYVKLHVCVHLADFLVNDSGYTFGSGLTEPALMEGSWEALGLSPDMSKNLMINLKSDMEKASIFLRRNQPTEE